jgi:hypothetical protein
MTDLRHPVFLCLPNHEPRQIGTISAPSDEALAARLLARYPLLPLHHVRIGDRPLAGLLQALAPPPVKTQTEGQRQWQERKRRQRQAEQWRQHWIDKDNAKRQRR